MVPLLAGCPILHRPGILDCLASVIVYLLWKAPSMVLRFAPCALAHSASCIPTGQPLSRQTSTEDRAKQAATLFLEDLGELVQATITPHFALSRYAEHIARSASSFDGLLAALEEQPSLTDHYMLDALWRHIEHV